MAEPTKYHTYLKRSEYKDLMMWKLKVGESCEMHGHVGTFRTYVSALNKLTPRNFFMKETQKIRDGVTRIKIVRIK